MGILISENNENKFDTLHYVHERILRVTINLDKLEKDKINIFIAYARDANRNQEETKQFHETAEAPMYSMPQQEENIEKGTYEFESKKFSNQWKISIQWTIHESNYEKLIALEHTINTETQ